MRTFTFFTPCLLVHSFINTTGKGEYLNRPVRDPYIPIFVVTFRDAWKTSQYKKYHQTDITRFDQTYQQQAQRRAAAETVARKLIEHFIHSINN